MFLSKQWRYPKFLSGLLIFELPITVAILALSGIASPDLYRTKLWQEGGDQGFNSKPSTVVYALANYRPVKVPTVWSDFNTHYLLVISVLTMFFYLVKSIMFITNTLWPILGLGLHIALAAIWAASVWAQTTPDTIDPAHQNTGPPWYITKSCGVASSDSLRKFCMQAKSSFAVTLIFLVLFSTWVLVAAWSLMPSKDQRAARASKVFANGSVSSSHNVSGSEKGPRSFYGSNETDVEGLPAPENTATRTDPWRSSQWEMNHLEGNRNYAYTPSNENAAAAQSPQQPLYSPGSTMAMKSPAFAPNTGGVVPSTPRSTALHQLSGNTPSFSFDHRAGALGSNPIHGGGPTSPGRSDLPLRN